ncbi:DNA-directed RNA polymerase [Candidatus Woesearchaeota archaeon]|nr:DNA-directed RNA polymerase [Candidatus Woesearchaeota archaeon]
MKRDNRNKRRGRDSNSSRGRDFNSSFDSNKRWAFSGPREMHKAKCAECGCECEVPFKPTEGRPVYCKECYRKRKTSW